MALTDIKLRILTHPDLVTTNVAKTWQEEDQNWIETYNAIKVQNSGTSLTPYAPATTYTGTVFVSYASNIWKHISPTPSTGVTPSTNPAVWQLSSAGELAHAPNTDSALASGTANEVQASVAAELLNNQVISVTRTAFRSLINTSALKKNRTYFINDMNWFVQTNNESQPNRYGIAIVRVPKYGAATIVGCWKPSPVTFGASVYVTWNNAVYRHKTTTNTVNAPNIDATNWEVVVSTDNLFYIDQPVNVFFQYNFNTIEKFIDLYGNESNDGSNLTTIGVGNSNVTKNVAINGTINAVQYAGTNFANNTVVNGTLSASNGIETAIRQNIVRNASIDIRRNGTTGEFIGNTFENCLLTFANATTIQKTSIVLHSSLREVSINIPNRSLENKTVTPFSSDVETIIALNGATTLNLDSIGQFRHVCGIIQVSSNTGFESIDTCVFSNWISGKTLIVKPITGVVLDVTTTSTAGSVNDDKLISELTAGTYRLEGNLGDFMLIVDKANLSGKQPFQIKIFKSQ